jgi:hypothetical protein
MNYLMFLSRSPYSANTNALAPLWAPRHSWYTVFPLRRGGGMMWAMEAELRILDRGGERRPGLDFRRKIHGLLDEQDRLSPQGVKGLRTFCEGIIERRVRIRKTAAGSWRLTWPATGERKAERVLDLVLREDGTCRFTLTEGGRALQKVSQVYFQEGDHITVECPTEGVLVRGYDFRVIGDRLFLNRGRIPRELRRVK